MENLQDSCSVNREESSPSYVYSFSDPRQIIGLGTFTTIDLTTGFNILETFSFDSNFFPLLYFLYTSYLINIKSFIFDKANFKLNTQEIRWYDGNANDNNGRVQLDLVSSAHGPASTNRMEKTRVCIHSQI